MTTLKLYELSEGIKNLMALMEEGVKCQIAKSIRIAT